VNFLNLTNDIEQALAEINAIAPTAAKHESLLRSMLRRRLESGQQIDDFSLNQMLTMEDRIRGQLSAVSCVLDPVGSVQPGLGISMKGKA